MNIWDYVAARNCRDTRPILLGPLYTMPLETSCENEDSGLEAERCVQSGYRGMSCDRYSRQ